MKRKIFSAIAVVLFLGSSFTSATTMTLSDNNCSFNYDHCYTNAQLRTFIAAYWGFSPSEAYEMGSNAFDNCVSDVDIAAAICLANQ